MDRNIINKHNFVLTGFALVFLFFGLVLYHEYSSEGARQSVIGYVVLEDGVRVSVDKMDEALVREISSGEQNPRIVVKLDERVTQQEFLDELHKNIVVGEQNVTFEKNEESSSLISVKAEKSLFSFLEKNTAPDFTITGTSQSEAVVAGEVQSADALVELTKNRNVKKIYLDYPVKVDLDKSVKQINALNVWNVSVNGSGIIGRGKSVCVIDTGVDYTHTGLGGGCSPSTYALHGDVSAFNSVESSHPYSDNSDVRFVVQKEGFSSIAVHFVKIDLEQISSAGDTTDRIYVYDGFNRTVAVYKGVLNDVWSPAVEGDTLSIRLVSDGSVSGYGFTIDSVINGTTNVSMDWSSCSKVIGGYDVYNNDADPKDDHGHGTHVAGIIGSTDAVYKGVAPGAGIVVLKALSGSGSGYASDVLAAIEWCTSNAQRLNISVISMSLGCDGGSCPHYQSACDDDLLAPVIKKAVDKNIMVTIASGNSGWVDGISSPSCISSVIAVGGVNGADSVVYNRGKLLKVVAPAQGITSSFPANGWKSLSGTSMATPHVAGGIVLLQDYMSRINGSVLGVEEVKSRLFNSGKVVVDSSSGLNFSRIDVYATLGIVINSSVITNTTFANNTFLNNTNVTLPLAITNNSVSLFGAVIRSLDNVTVNDSVLFSVGVNESVLNVSTVALSYSINGSKVVNKSMVLHPESGLFGVVVNNSAWLANTTVVYWASAFDLLGNYTQSGVLNFTVQMAVMDQNISNGSSLQNQTVVNETIVPVSVFNITYPVNGSVIEVGSGVMKYSAEGVSGNDSVVWLFGDGLNSTLFSGEKQFNTTGIYAIQLVRSTNGTSMSYTRIVIVNDTVGPVVSNVNFVKSVDYSKNISQLVSMGLFDYSGIGGFNLTLGNQSFSGNCTNGTVSMSCRWVVLGLGLGSKELLLTVQDGFSVSHSVTQTFSFIVMACKDGVKNGDETAVDCGGSCGVCANVSSIVPVDVPVVAEVPVAAATKVEENKAAEVKVPVAEVKKAEQAVSVAAKTEEKSATVVGANSSLRVPEELVSKEVEKKYTVLYILGALVAGLAGLYVFMMREGL